MKFFDDNRLLEANLIIAGIMIVVVGVWIVVRFNVFGGGINLSDVLDSSLSGARSVYRDLMRDFQNTFEEF